MHLETEPYGERSSTLAIAPDGKFFILGTNEAPWCFDAAGVEQWRRSVRRGVEAVNLSADGGLVVAACGDGIIRWYRADNGRELLAFFPHANGLQWVLWTPDGYYDCPPGSEKIFGWHVDRGLEQAVDFFPATHFRDKYYRPDVISRVLGTRDGAEAVRLADEKAGKKTL